MLQLIARTQDIKSAINQFKSSYHHDFSRVRSVAKRHLLAATAEEHSAELAHELHAALSNWGAGKRMAPTLRPVSEIATGMAENHLRQRLTAFSNLGLSGLSLSAQKLRIFTTEAGFDCLDTFDKELLGTLNTLAASLFVDSTNVTYPMKALLLITGFMPALDSQVRKGLTRGGMKGLGATQLLLPKLASRALGQRICLLPFSLGHCWQLNHEVLQDAIRQSDHPGLATEPGRVFDVLLFMQQEPQRAPLLLVG